MNPTRETLIAARALIEQGWCQKRWSSNKIGDENMPKSKDVFAFCTVGALLEASKGWRDFRCAKVNFAESLGIDNSSVFDWNDAPERTQAEVLEAFDKAIAECGE